MSTRVVVVGGGFGGLLAARGLGDDGLEVTLVDRQNYFLFQPLVYQVATGSLSSVEVAAPLRQVLRRRRSTQVLLGEVTAFDLDQRLVTVERLPNGEARRLLPYDVLVVAGGSGYSYFGHEDWEQYAPQLKTLEGALDLRARILSAFEAAEAEREPAARKAFLTFVVVGAGTTGVEMAGQIAELRHVLRNEFRTSDTDTVSVLLVEAAPDVLPAYSARLSRSAEQQLRSLGVTPLLETTVVDVGDGFVEVEPRGGERRRIDARTVVWAAGVRASPLATALAEAAGVATGRGGRIEVEPDLTLPDHPEVFALGDMVSVRDRELPGIAPVAMQEGRHVAQSIRTGTRSPFHYRDKGELATIGRSRAVGTIAGVEVTGFAAWVLWLGVHLTYLVGFQNRVLVFIRWVFSYVTRGRGARVIHRTPTV